MVRTHENAIPDFFIEHGIVRWPMDTYGVLDFSKILDCARRRDVETIGIRFVDGHILKRLDYYGLEFTVYGCRDNLNKFWSDIEGDPDLSFLKKD